MAGWKLTLVTTALCASIGSGTARANAPEGSVPARVVSKGSVSVRDTSVDMTVRLLRWDQQHQTSRPFGRLARPVAFKVRSGKGTRKHYDSTMELDWSYKSAVPTGPGPLWTYDGERASVRSHVTRFRTFDEKDEDYAPSWSAHSDLAPAGGFGELVSLMVSYYEDAGGAHGTSYQKFVTLSGRTGLPLKLSQVLNAKSCARIRSAIVDSLAPESLSSSTEKTINERFAVQRVQDTLRVSIALNYVLDGNDSPPSIFLFDLPMRALLPGWRPAR